MKILITNFSNLKYFKPNQIPISTCNSDPKFFHNNTYNNHICFVDKNGIMNGIREESFLLPKGCFEALEEHCEPNCPYTYKNPHCQFLDAYRANLELINTDYLLSEFMRVAEDVRKITNYSGEPEIVLLVWESEKNKCSERWPIIEWFKSKNIIVENFKK